MIMAALFVNAVLCTDLTHADCQPAEFMWSPPEGNTIALRVQECRMLAHELNKAQDDKAVFYRCDSIKGVEHA